MIPTITPDQTIRAGAHRDQAGRPGEATVVAATAATAAFAAGGVLTQLVIVPAWRGMEPSAFLARFPTAGPTTGAVLFPIEITSVALLGRITYIAIRHGQPGRAGWALATASMVGTVLLLPVYFAGANRAMLDPLFPPNAVADELAAW